MYCAYCGEAFSVNTKFCPYCGKATLLGNPELKYKESNNRYPNFETFYEGREKIICVGDKSLHISKEWDCFNAYRRTFRESAVLIMKFIIPQFHEKLRNVIEIFEYMNQFMYEVYNLIFKQVSLTLESAGARNVDADCLEKTFFNSVELMYQKDLNNLLDKYNSILSKKHNGIKAVAAFLPNGYIAGSVGGFIAGSALNWGAGTLIDSQLNSTNISSADKKRLYENCDFETWFDHIYDDLKNFVYYFFELLQEANIIDYSPYSLIRKNRAEAIFNSVNEQNGLTINEWTNYYFDILSCNPYEEQYYRAYRKILEKLGNNYLKDQFNSLIAYFVIDNVDEFNLDKT